MIPISESRKTIKELPGITLYVYPIPVMADHQNKKRQPKLPFYYFILRNLEFDTNTLTASFSST